MANQDGTTRRAFLGAGAVILGGRSAMAQNAAEVPKRPFGKTGLQVSVLGVGGFHLGAAKDEPTAKQIVDRALDGGINFFDNAWEYHEGQSEAWLGNALRGKRDRAIVMTKVCTHGRDRTVAMNGRDEDA